MFTGIIEEIGKIKALVAVLLGKRFFIAAHTILSDLHVGDSIAVNGVCLTVTEFNTEGFWVEAVAETLRLTNLGDLAEGSAVNLERSLTLEKRLGGHLLQGHIDSRGHILDIQQEGQALLLRVALPPHLSRYCVCKGYIGLDGMSLTLIEVNADSFTLTLIPHTQQASIAGQYQVGQSVNIEVDMLAKYVEKLCQASASVSHGKTHLN